MIHLYCWFETFVCFWAGILAANSHTWQPLFTVLRKCRILQFKANVNRLQPKPACFTRVNLKIVHFIDFSLCNISDPKSALNFCNVYKCKMQVRKKVKPCHLLFFALRVVALCCRVSMKELILISLTRQTPSQQDLFCCTDSGQRLDCFWSNPHLFCRWSARPMGS